MKPCRFWHNWHIMKTLLKGQIYYGITRCHYPILWQRLRTTVYSNWSDEEATIKYGSFDTITESKKTRYNRICKDCGKVELQIDEALPAMVESDIQAWQEEKKLQAKMDSALKVHRMKYGASS